MVPPLLGGEPASVITAHAATLRATVNPENSATSIYFQYGGSEAYGQQTPVESAGSGLGESDVLKRIEGLAASAIYHYRVVATNEQGMTAYGPDETFTTGAEGIPTVQTGPASDVTPTGASISGTVDPEGVETSYAFEVGTDTTYSGARIYGEVGAGEGRETIAATLGDLAPGTTYHYRLSATNMDGTSYGQDMTFTTASVPSPIAQPLSLALLATPGIAFPIETGTAITTKALTRAQKLAKALKACRKKTKASGPAVKSGPARSTPRSKSGAKKKHNKQH